MSGGFLKCWCDPQFSSILHRVCQNHFGVPACMETAILSVDSPYPPTPAYAKAGAAPGIAVGVKLAAGFALALPWPLKTGLVTVFSAGLGTR